jgi:hypothetical protein
LKTRHKFRPSVGPSLEDRIAPGHAGVAAEVLALPRLPSLKTAKFHGSYTTTVQVGVDTVSAVARLTSTGSLGGIGVGTLAGSLSNNRVVPSLTGPTQGTVRLASAGLFPGSLTLALTGPYTNLAPTGPSSAPLTFTVTGATRGFASLVGAQGTATLNMSPHGPAPGGLPSNQSAGHGRFSLALVRT